MMRSPRLLLATALLVVSTAATTFTADPASTAMASAATKWLASLTQDQQKLGHYELASGERTPWHFIPSGAAAPGFPRNGLTLKEMQPAQRTLAMDLLKTGLSQRGYLTATQIMALETTLGAMEAEMRAAGQATPFMRDSERYYVAVFGTPAASGSWSWRFEGHHISLHFTIADGAITVSTPTFFGTNPAEVRVGEKKGLRILSEFEDPARQLLNTFTAEQRVKGVIPGDAPGDILTFNRFPIDPLTPGGLVSAEMTAQQRQLLMGLIEAYAAQMNPDIAALRLGQLRKAGVEKVAFAWAGSAVRGEKHYYRVQGPTFLIEFDNTQNDANHVHSVWRDFTGDFGRDLLREHLRGQ